MKGLEVVGKDGRKYFLLTLLPLTLGLAQCIWSQHCFISFLALASEKRNGEWFSIRKADSMAIKMHASGQSRRCIYEEMKEAHPFTKGAG